MVLNRLTCLNPKTRRLLIDKKIKADVARPRQLPMQGGSQLLKWTGIQKKILQKLGFMSRKIESKATTNNLIFLGVGFGCIS
ncbi:hypothetical protein GIB67_027117 [Kingdonia uniflora]|uniref:Uncharacterized protein n=1 Tax=Kingdonia uniflora TaxID=39325 RepID=A0A7J7P2G3_9MAGN|nr:hypothetical protein GIB67_027117 [Kingdonia uniflora]